MARTIRTNHNVNRQYKQAYASLVDVDALELMTELGITPTNRVKAKANLRGLK